LTADASVVVCPNCGRKNRVPAAAAGTPRCGHCHNPLPWIVDAGDDSFAERVEQARMPVLVDLWAPWCGPCRAVSPALENLARDRAGRIKLVKVNVDESPAIAARFGARGYPRCWCSTRGRW
jgi:thioredoxin 2